MVFVVTSESRPRLYLETFAKYVCRQYRSFFLRGNTRVRDVAPNYVGTFFFQFH